MTWGRLAELSALLLEYLLLMTAFKITLTGSIKRVIWTYIGQSVILAAVTGFTAYQRLSETLGDTRSHPGRDPPADHGAAAGIGMLGEVIASSRDRIDQGA